MAEITKVGFQLGSSLGSKHLTDAEYIKGGYFVVDTYANLVANYSIATDTEDGTIVDGSLCYCQEDNKFYQFTDDAWVEAKMSGEPLIKVTYKELRSLRDNGKLIPGQQYQITDYVTMTSQENTRSAGHKFDIIVTADSEKVLNENARATYHCNEDGILDPYFITGSDKLAINSASIKQNVNIEDIEFLAGIFVDHSAPYHGGDLHASSKVISEICTFTNTQGIEVPALLNPAPDRDEGNNLLYVYAGKEQFGYINNLVNIQYVLTQDNEIEYVGDSPIHNDDIFVEIGTAMSGDLYLYKTDPNVEGISSVDYDDEFIYAGDFEIDGITYNKWLKSEGNESTSYIILTDIIVVDGKFIVSPEEFKANIAPIICDKWQEYKISTGEYEQAYHLTNEIVDVTFESPSTNSSTLVSILPSWELKYCLDNDKYKFVWAVEDNIKLLYPKSLHAEDSDYLIRQPAFDGRSSYGDYFYAWGTQSDVDDDDSANFVYSKNATIYQGEQVFVAIDNCLSEATIEITESSGKGIIYYMKDEYNNECPYDFKNIQFTRLLDNKYYLDLENGSDTWCYTFGGKTDRSINQNGLVAFNNNSISTFYENKTYSIPNNVFLDNNYSVSTSNTKLGNNCSFNTFCGECSFNTFGNDCNNNTFNAECINNTFGRYCNNNTFGFECDRNTFGDYCNDNTFEYYCKLNTFGSNCSNNIFGSSCQENIFENSCNANTFGDSCNNNYFKDTCMRNTLGDYCSKNSFGEYCINNIFGSSCVRNIFGHSCGFNGLNYFAKNCTDNVLGNGNNSITLRQKCVSNIFGNNCNASSIGEESINNSFGNNCINITFEKNCTSNVLGNGCSVISLGESCSSNIFGNDCTSNTLGNECTSNTFGNYCEHNSFDENCWYNTLLHSCSQNSFGMSCAYNTLKEECFENTLFGKCCYNTFESGCGRNNLSDSCQENYLGIYCCDNIFGADCMTNKFVQNCNNNELGDSCWNNIFDYGCNSNVFNTACNNNTFGRECSYNTFDFESCWNTFGYHCQNNTWTDWQCVGVTLGHFCEYISFSQLADKFAFAFNNINIENYVKYVNIRIEITDDFFEDDLNVAQNIRICSNINGSSTINPKNLLVKANVDYEQKFILPNSVVTEVEY